MTRTRIHGCEVKGEEGVTITYRFTEDCVVLESGRVKSYKEIEERYEAFLKVRAWVAENPG